VESENLKLAKVKQILIDTVKETNPKANLKKISKAFDFAAQAHSKQKRSSGELYIYHPFEVAMILTDLKLDTASIVTALLHDTVEDTGITMQDIEKEFGSDIAKLVDGVTKLAKIEFQPEHIKQAENFRKLFLAISEDIRVLLVKLADRLHNMRTLGHRSIEKRLKTAHETMEIYAPLAERIGIHKFKNELQDLAFSVLHPDIKKSIQSRLRFLRKEGSSIVETIIKEITQTLEAAGIKAEVTGREKTACSIWRKMERKNVAFEQLADIIAFRVMVDNISDCYNALGAIHTKYHMIPGEFKDFISTPKTNNYQSLHTIVMGPEQKCIEIQIRTESMHEIAELGVAAHWAYKQKQSVTDGTQYRWIRELLEILENTSSAEEFLENTKLEMYYDQVFCFSPKGELIALPRGATPVDFAFAVHTDLGLRCIGAKINGRIVPLKTALHNGDQVEILKSKTPMPSPSWDKFVVTGKARAEIRKFIRSKQKQEYINLGKAVLIKTFSEAGKDFKEQDLKQLLEKFNKETVEDIIAEVGEGIISRSEVLKALHPEDTSKARINPLSLLRLKSKKDKKDAESSMPISGLIPGMALHFAGCCHPLPGDRIVGIVNSGKGITIHTSDCEMLENFSATPERWIDVSWEGTIKGDYTGRLKVILSNAVGSLAHIANKIASEKSNISNIKIVGRSLDFFEIVIDIEVKGIHQLSNLIVAIRSLSCVHSVERYKS